MDASLFLASEGRRAAIAQQQENSTRPATCALTYTTTGTGQIILNQPLMFDVTFIQEPALSTGKHLEKVDDPRIWQYPISDSGIWRWERDRNGYYTGAYFYFYIRVDVLPEYLESLNTLSAAERQIKLTALALYLKQPKITHHLIFQGPAMKELPHPVTSELPSGTLTVRTVPVMGNA